MSNRFQEVNTLADILPEYRDTPIGMLLEYHNLNRPFVQYKEAKLLIGMCIDNRQTLWIPENFAFIMRSAGANLIYHEFQISMVASLGKIQHLALIAHNDCRTVDLHTREEEFVSGMVRYAGWSENAAREHFERLSPFFGIGSETDFVLSEARRIARRFPGLQVAPLLYNVDDNRLYQVRK